MDHQNSILWGGSWAAQSSSVPPQLSYKQIHFHSPSSSHFLSLSLSLHTTTGQADGSPSAHRARKSMWIKGYTQQVWRAASIIAVRQRGGGSSPPAFQALGHLAGVLWNDERAAANPCYCHHGRHRAERRSRRLFSFSALKWNKWAGVRLSGGLRGFARVHLCAISKQEDWVVVMPCIWMWWLVWATLAVRKVKVKSQNVAM